MSRTEEELRRGEARGDEIVKELRRSLYSNMSPICPIPEGRIYIAEELHIRVAIGFVAGLVFGTLGALFVLKGWPL